MTVEIVPTRDGRQMYLTTDTYFAPLLENYGEYVYGESDLFRQLVREGDTVVDAGANVGCHSLTFGKIVGPFGMVMAFEPQRPLYYCLCGTVALNECWQVNTYCCALGAEKGLTKIPFIRYSESNSFGGVSVGGAIGHDVPMLPLDSFDLPRCNFIKADVEGYETEVLLGATDTIKRCRPFLYCENDRHEHSAKLIDTMLSFDYRLWLHTPTLYHERNFKGSKDNLFPQVASIMLLGIPSEMNVGNLTLRPIRSPDDMLEFGEHKI